MNGCSESHRYVRVKFVDLCVLKQDQKISECRVKSKPFDECLPMYKGVCYPTV